jgi:hypothetical protein
VGFGDFVVTGYKESRQDWRCLKMGLLESVANCLFAKENAAWFLLCAQQRLLVGQEESSSCWLHAEKETLYECCFLWQKVGCLWKRKEVTISQLVGSSGAC